MTKPHIKIENGRYCVRHMAVWCDTSLLIDAFVTFDYMPGKRKLINQQEIIGYGQTAPDAWAQFQYWHDKLIGEPYQCSERVP